MSATFAAASRRLAGLAGAVLGWPPDRFWAATPADLAMVVDALVGAGPDGTAPPDAATRARLQKEFPDG